MLTLLTERHICIYKRDIDSALGKHKKIYGRRAGADERRHK